MYEMHIGGTGVLLGWNVKARNSKGKWSGRGKSSKGGFMAKTRYKV
jgi:hypothetical protein